MFVIRELGCCYSWVSCRYLRIWWGERVGVLVSRRVIMKLAEEEASSVGGGDWPHFPSSASSSSGASLCVEVVRHAAGSFEGDLKQRVRQKVSWSVPLPFSAVTCDSVSSWSVSGVRFWGSVGRELAPCRSHHCETRRRHCSSLVHSGLFCSFCAGSHRALRYHILHQEDWKGLKYHLLKSWAEMDGLPVCKNLHQRASSSSFWRIRSKRFRNGEQRER